MRAPLGLNSITCDHQSNTGLLPEAPGGWSRTNTGAKIDVDQEKKVDLGVLRDADHDGRVQKLPLSTVDGVALKFEVTP